MSSGFQNKQRKKQNSGTWHLLPCPSLPAGWGGEMDVHEELSDLKMLLLAQLNLPVFSGPLPMSPPLWSLPGIPSWVCSLPCSASQTLVMLGSHGNFNILGPSHWELRMCASGGRVRYITCLSQSEIKMWGLLYKGKKRFFFLFPFFGGGISVLLLLLLLLPPPLPPPSSPSSSSFPSSYSSLQFASLPVLVSPFFSLMLHSLRHRDTHGTSEKSHKTGWTVHPSQAWPCSARARDWRWQLRNIPQNAGLHVSQGFKPQHSSTVPWI